ncbi:MAG: hypothetical protein J0M08_06080 [Bacteroidetes bacterium]|nr:hypothetical protein [Bacteroidota bacterium]
MRILLLIIISALCACTTPIKYSDVKVNNQFSIHVPDFMQPTNEIHQKAALQYQNLEKEFYLLVINESKEQMKAYDLDYDLDSYYKNIVSTPFTEQLKNGKVSMPGRMDIHGKKALISEITGNINNADIYYKLTVIESPEHFYQVVTWTKAENKEKMSLVMDSVIQSFKEIN